MESHCNCDDGKQAHVRPANTRAPQGEDDYGDPDEKEREAGDANLQRPLRRDAEEANEEGRNAYGR